MAEGTTWRRRDCSQGTKEEPNQQCCLDITSFNKAGYYFVQYNYVYLMNNVYRLLLLAAGYAWMLAIPFPNLGRNTYIDENALQPGQVWTQSRVISRQLMFSR